MPKIKIIFCDVDNTLITGQAEILPSVSSAVKDYVKSGGIFVLTSARSPMALEKLSQELECNSLLISLNGSLVLQAVEKSGQVTTLFEKTMQPNVLPAILRIIQQEQLALSVNVYAGKKWFVNSHDKWVRQEEKITGAMATVGNLPKKLGTSSDPVNKILCMGEPADIDRLAVQLDHIAGLKINYLRSKPTYLEIVDESVSKMKAIEEVTKINKISIAETMAIGDGENDLPMIIDAGIGIAVGNAFPSVKQAASHTVASNEAGGVAEAIRKYSGLAD